MLGLTFGGAHGLGDKLQFSSMPENYFRNTGKFLVDMDSCWMFNHNPYVLRGEKVDEVCNPWNASGYFNNILNSPGNSYFVSSMAERNCRMMGWKRCFLERPSLYFPPLSKPTEKILCLHVGAKDAQRRMPLDIARHVAEEYSDFVIFQVGGPEDPKVDAGTVKDIRGLPMWNTVEMIRNSDIFVGGNSGMMHVANCFPHLVKKIVITEMSRAQLEDFFPWKNGKDHQWFYRDNLFYNTGEDRVGITSSYKKI